MADCFFKKPTSKENTMSFSTPIYENTQQREILYQLEKMDSVFHLSGSRLSKTNTELSDWDFFCLEEQPEQILYGKLHELGFEQEYNECSYKDYSIKAVWRHSCLIDIQIVKQEYLKSKILANKFLLQTSVGKQFLGRDKTINKKVWTEVIYFFQHSLDK
jgi:hypothetical protein